MTARHSGPSRLARTWRLAILLGAFVAAAAAIPAVPSLSGAAQAQGLFGGVAGQDCRAFQDAGGAFWQGFVRGREESPFLRDDGLYETTARRCFQTRAQCDAWLYDTQSALVTVSRTWCRQYG